MYKRLFFAIYRLTCAVAQGADPYSTSTMSSSRPRRVGLIPGGDRGTPLAGGEKGAPLTGEEKGAPLPDGKRDGR